MNTTHPTGLGEPEPIGKKFLFQPPDKEASYRKSEPANQTNGNREPLERVRTTIDLTRNALAILQKIQNQHRLETGKVLPLWKAVSQAIELYGISEMKEKDENQDSISD